MKEIEKSYDSLSIHKDFNATKKDFYQHIVEYFSHRSKWDKIFLSKLNRDKVKKPIKMEVAKEVEIKDMDIPKPESEQKELFTDIEKKKPLWKPNPSLIRRIWEQYSGKTIIQSEKEAEKLSEKVEKLNEKTITEIANKVDNWTEIENIKFGDINVQEIKDYAESVDNQTKNKLGYTEKLREETKNNLKPKIGKYINDSTGIEANLSGASIDKMSSGKAIEKSKANGFSVDEHFEVVNNILQLWKDAELVETRPDKNGSTNLLSIKRFDADTVLSSGKNAVAHITVKESVQYGHKIYSVEVIDIEQKNNGQENPNRFNGGAELNQTSTSNENNITETKNVNTDTSKLSEAMMGNQNAKKMV